MVGWAGGRKAKGGTCNELKMLRFCSGVGLSGGTHHPPTLHGHAPLLARATRKKHAVPAQMWAGVIPVPVQMWHGVSPVPVRMWHGVSPVFVMQSRG